MPPKRRGETSGAEPTKRRRWTPDEENELRTLVGELGAGAWPAVAQRLGTGRSAAAVELHWKGTAASAPSAAQKPAKRARKSTAKRAAKSAAKPAATLAADSLAALPPPGAAKRAPPPGTRVAVRFDDQDYEGTVGDALDDGTSATVKFDDGNEHPIDFTESGIRITREAPAAAPPPAAKPAAKAKPRAPPAAKKPQSKPAPRPPRAAPTPAAAPEQPAAKKPRTAPQPEAAPAPARRGRPPAKADHKSSRFAGVTWNPYKGGRWHAAIMVRGHTILLGEFDVEEDAARAYDAAQSQWGTLIRGDRARINFPGEAPLASALAALPPLPWQIDPAPLPPRRRSAPPPPPTGSRVAVRFSDGVDQCEKSSFALAPLMG